MEQHKKKPMRLRKYEIPGYSYHRLVVKHDPIIGYRFVPNIYSRINRKNQTFVIQTNEQGFRNNTSFDKMKNGKLSVLALGDSYVAGDGISNNERFTDIISDRFNINVLNMGLPGSGTDQQLLIQEKIAYQWNYDILLFVPFLLNSNRNFESKMNFVDWATGNRIDILKPCFTLDDRDESLAVHNYPVPKWKIKHTEDPETKSSNHLTRKVQLACPMCYWFLRKTYKIFLASFLKFGFRTKLLKADRDYEKSNNSRWRLMHAIIEKMISNAGARPVIILPIPLPRHVSYGANPNYLNRFKELRKENVYIVDILPFLKKLSRKEKIGLYLPDGHFSAKANQIIASCCEPVFAKLIKDKQTVSSQRGRAFRNSSSKYILGISCFYHDSAAALIKDGQIIGAAQEERFTRVKHDKSFPGNAVQYCLEEGRIDGKDLHAIVYYDNEALSLERMLATQIYLGERSRKSWKRSMGEWLDSKFRIWSHIQDQIGYGGPYYRAIHHRSHAASAFYPSPFYEAAIITIDGVGEWSTTTIGVGEGNQITMLKEQRFPHSLGLLYSAFTSFCGFKVNSGEYKLMGLAPYGRPTYREGILRNLIEIRDDGSFQLNLKYFSFLEGERMTNKMFANLFGGPARQPESQITQRECDIASSIQKVTEEVMLRITEHAYELTGKKNLVMSGGVALNCVANGRILRQGPFKEIWIQPAAGDAGGAVGAALDLWYGTWKKPRHKNTLSITDQHNCCFGPSFSDDEIKSFLELHGYPYHLILEKNRAMEIAQHLVNGDVVGHFVGRMEFGPRALGSRSILGDPRKVETQRILNLKIKYRESFRPFAPIVLEEKISDYFNIDRPSPYMLLVAPVSSKIRYDVNEDSNFDILKRLKQKRSSIPAVTHVDYSARIQSVNKERYPEIYEVLRAFERETGCGVLVNTSFNVRGEPIVCTPSDAYRCFMRTEMDILILNNFLLKRSEQPPFKEETDWRLEYALD